MCLFFVYLNLNWCCLHFTAIFTFVLSSCRWIYLWSCWGGLIVAALEGRLSNFYACTKVFFFWLTWNCTHILSHRWIYLSWNDLGWSQRELKWYLFVFHVLCRVKSLKSLHCIPIWSIGTSFVVSEPLYAVQTCLLLTVIRLEDWNLVSFCIDGEKAKGPTLAEE